MPSRRITLEMLTKAREIADTVEVFMAGDGDDFAEELGDHGADDGLRHRRSRRRPCRVSPVASAVAAAIEGGDVDAPDAFMLGTT